MENCKKLINFLDKSYTCYHAINNIEEMLVSAGFEKLTEFQSWVLETGRCYYVIKNSSSIIAFKVPAKLENPGFQIVASHSDSPSYKINYFKSYITTIMSPTITTIPTIIHYLALLTIQMTITWSKD